MRCVPPEERNDGNHKPSCNVHARYLSTSRSAWAQRMILTRAKQGETSNVRRTVCGKHGSRGSGLVTLDNPTDFRQKNPEILDYTPPYTKVSRTLPERRKPNSTGRRRRNESGSSPTLPRPDQHYHHHAVSVHGAPFSPLLTCTRSSRFLIFSKIGPAWSPSSRSFLTNCSWPSSRSSVHCAWGTCRSRAPSPSTSSAFAPTTLPQDWRKSMGGRHRVGCYGRYTQVSASSVRLWRTHAVSRVLRGCATQIPQQGRVRAPVTTPRSPRGRLWACPSASRPWASAAAPAPTPAPPSPRALSPPLPPGVPEACHPVAHHRKQQQWGEDRGELFVRWKDEVSFGWMKGRRGKKTRQDKP